MKNKRKQIRKNPYNKDAKSELMFIMNFYRIPEKQAKIFVAAAEHFDLEPDDIAKFLTGYTTAETVRQAYLYGKPVPDHNWESILQDMDIAVLEAEGDLVSMTNNDSGHILKAFRKSSMNVDSIDAHMIADASPFTALVARKDHEAMRILFVRHANDVAALAERPSSWTKEQVEHQCDLEAAEMIAAFDRA